MRASLLAAPLMRATRMCAALGLLCKAHLRLATGRTRWRQAASGIPVCGTCQALGCRVKEFWVPEFSARWQAASSPAALRRVSEQMSLVFDRLFPSPLLVGPARCGLDPEEQRQVDIDLQPPRLCGSTSATSFHAPLIKGFEPLI